MRNKAGENYQANNYPPFQPWLCVCVCVCVRNVATNIGTNFFPNYITPAKVDSVPGTVWIMSSTAVSYGALNLSVCVCVYVCVHLGRVLERGMMNSESSQAGFGEWLPLPLFCLDRSGFFFNFHWIHPSVMSFPDGNWEQNLIHMVFRFFRNHKHTEKIVFFSSVIINNCEWSLLLMWSIKKGGGEACFRHIWPPFPMNGKERGITLYARILTLLNERANTEGLVLRREQE